MSSTQSNFLLGRQKPIALSIIAPQLPAFSPNGRTSKMWQKVPCKM